MLRKSIAMMIMVFILLLLIPAATASEEGVFGVLSQEEGADERLAVLDEAAEELSVIITSDEFNIQVSQAYYEGNRIYISYKMSGVLYVQDGLDMESGAYADIIAGEEIDLEDGSVIGWKECIVPDEEIADTQIFSLVFGQSYESDEKNRLTFSVNRHEYDQLLQGVSSAETCQAQAKMFMGKVDLKGIVRLISPEQAASWIAWQEGEEETGTDVIACWNLYQNGEPVSADLYGASRVEGTDEVIFEVMFPHMDDLSGLSLVPEYSEGGENPDEAISLVPVTQE